MDVKRISHASLTTPDLARQIDYYTNILGLHLVAREGNRAWLATGQGVLAVVLEQGDRSSCDKLAFQVAPGSDLAELRAGLAADGIASDLQSDPGPGLSQRLAFQDPKGTGIEILSDVALLDRPTAQTTLSLLKLGHLAFNVLDVPSMTDFYVRHLGFRISDMRTNIFSFLRCGPDHHTINFAQTHTGQVKMHHIAFELKDWAEIQRACDFLGRNNIRLVWGPGRHLIGHNVFIYHRNPEGQIIEMYTELDQMKVEDLGYFDPRSCHQDQPQVPKTWPLDTLSNYWGAGAPPGFGD